MTLHCNKTDSRRSQLIQSNFVNGIDYVQTLPVDKDAPEFIVEITFFHSPSNSPNGEFIESLNEKSIVVFDMRRNAISPVSDVMVVLEPDPVHPERNLPESESRRIRFRMDEARVGRIYQLSLVQLENGLRTNYVLEGFDPPYSTAEFSFYYESLNVSSVDPLPAATEAVPSMPEPEINYLAKDYQSFRSLILDRLAKIMPDWQEHHAADVGMTLVELLAYTGDQLSYAQDATATESYLETARQRISVRRHARLVDYKVHEGANAIGLIQLQTESTISLIPDQFLFITNPPSDVQLSNTVLNISELPEGIFQSVKVFEPIVEISSQWRLLETSFKDFEEFVNQLSTRKDPISRFLLDQIMNGKPSLNISNRMSERSIELLLQKLNQILSDSDFLSIASSDPSLHQQIIELSKDLECDSGPIMNRAVFDAIYRSSVSPIQLSNRIVCDVNQNEIHFYTWGETECVLAKGATSATLLDEPLENQSTCEGNSHDYEGDAPPRVLDSLSAGQILMLEEVKSPTTGLSADANPVHRQAVRLSKVKRGFDSVAKKKVLEIEWHLEDALQFPLCLSSQSQPSPSNPEQGCTPISFVSVARGNVVLVDHGRTINAESLGRSTGRWQQLDCGNDWEEAEWSQHSDPFTPALNEPNLTAVRKRTDFCPVANLFSTKAYQAKPSIRLHGTPAVPVSGESIPISETLLNTPDQLLNQLVDWHFNNVNLAASVDEFLSPSTSYLLNQYIRDQFENKTCKELEIAKLKKHLVCDLNRMCRWLPKNDLIDSKPSDQHFVVETDNHRRGHIRFGDNQYGKQPDVGTEFSVTYRVGSGVEGNVGAETINRMITKDGSGTAIVFIRNPLPTAGGISPETLRQIKIKAPHMYRENQNRAVLASDYEQIAMRLFGNRIQAARARVKQIGTHWQVDVVIDPLASERNFEKLRQLIELELQKYRRLQHRVFVSRGKTVPLDLRVRLKLLPTALRSEVYRDASSIFSSQELGVGRRGIFHPDEITFGQSIYVSQLVLAGRSIPGVKNFVVTHLSRLGGANVARGDGRDASDEKISLPSKNDASNVLEMGPLEIAQLENRGNDEKGVLRIELEGGK